MRGIRNLFASRWGVIAAGGLIGLLAVLLQRLGNPPNMGICVACFNRDIAGALGLHRASAVQYLRPEIIGFVLGSLCAALAFGEFRARAGSAPLVRFVLGACAMIGSLVFLGCPWRALLRLAGGDGNAILGLLGLVCGIFVGTLFMRKGYSLGRSQRTYASVGWIMPVIMLGLLALLLVFPERGAVDGRSGVLYYSAKGPGALHAPLLVSLGAGLVIGFIAQRGRFCTMGAFRDVILFRQVHLLSGVTALAAVAFLGNLILGRFSPGFSGQPAAHTMHFWNFAGMCLAGLAFALAGGCPGRQCFLAGEGDSDAAVFVLGMIAGAALSHNFGMASSGNGVGQHGAAAVAVGLVVCLLIGLTMREKTA
jgi:YedE family putative selenium metabolism protein